MVHRDFLRNGAGCVLVLACLILGVSAPNAQANELVGIRVAQFDADDTYDPFADYSEFDEAQDEEADINFFRNGRFVTVGLLGGMRGFTSSLGNMYQTAPSFGLFLSYFFDLRFAAQFSFQTSDHSFHLANPSGTPATGNVGITTFDLDLKYYVNTQNVTKGLAKLNPYIIGGFSRVDRTAQLDNIEGFSKEGAMGVSLGAGIELPMMHNKMFFGLQSKYQLVTFHNEHSEIIFEGGQRSGRYPTGDTYSITGILGVNF